MAQGICYETEAWLDKNLPLPLYKVFGKQAVASFLWERIGAPKQSLAQSLETGDHEANVSNTAAFRIVVFNLR